MPKIKWDLDSEAIDNAESEGFTPYAGPVPPAGVYKFTLKRLEATKSSAGNKMLKVLMELDADGIKERKKYHGCPVWDNVVVMDKTAWKVRQFLDALGVSASDFTNKTVAEEENSKHLVRKIGSLKVEGVELTVQIKRGANQEGDPRPEVQRYLPYSELDDSDTEDAREAQDDDEDAPF